MVEFIVGKVRVQFPVRDVVRIERMRKGKFCDADTLFVPDRSEFPGWNGAEMEETARGSIFSFGEYRLVVPSGGRSLSGVCLERNGKRVWRYKRTANTGELPAPGSTPEVFVLSDVPRIPIPAGGYASSERKTSAYKVDEGAEDIYLLLCGKDCKKLRRLYVTVAGRCELVRRSVLGLWDSRWYAYDEESAKQRILDYAAHDLPLDCLVIDTDWRAAFKRGIGYDVNTTLFPDLKRFFAFAHEHGVEVMFNDHPEPVEGAKDVFDPVEVRYREEHLQKLMTLGLDTWWYDRNWHTKLISPTPAIRPETLGMYLFYDITRHFYEKRARGDVFRRPVIMANVCNVANGRYDGSGEYSIADSASHRYSIQWTGDIHSDEAALGQEVETLVKAGANCIPYLNADCGGHTGNPDKTGYIRWMQFGAFSPVLRPHCTRGLLRSREPWAYDEETLDIVRRYIRLRYRLLPYLYSLAHESFDTGIPMCRALGFEYPGDRRACAETSEYLLGKDLLVAPIARYGEKWAALPKSCYAAPVRATYYAGRECGGKPLCTAQYEELSIYLDGTSPHPGVPVCDFSARFETTLCSASEEELAVLSDDGVTVWLDGKKVYEDGQTHAAQYARVGVLRPGVRHKVVIEYFQADGAACIALGLVQADRRFLPEARDVYFPAGKWINVFTGKVYAGARTQPVPCPLVQMPLFVRAGALLPLAPDAPNTRAQSWDRLAFALFPSPDAMGCGELVEDDGETTGYLHGEVRTCRYEARYDRIANCCRVRFFAAEGDYGTPEDVRAIELEIHLVAVKRVVRVLLDGKPLEFTLKKRDRTAFPLSFDGNAPDADVVCATFSFPVSKGAAVDVFCR